MSDKLERELSLSEMENINGGFKYKGPEGHKMNGLKIYCPFCKVEDYRLFKTVMVPSLESVIVDCIVCGKRWQFTKDGDNVKVRGR